jgi:menaquinone reductase, molybdopterin-binding-like subunit
MTLEITRRDLLRFCGGAAAGALVTPLPWKMVDDLAIWSQNPARIPRLPRGEASVRFTCCAICPAACGIRARCVGGNPVGLGGVPGHPAGGGALCPPGFAGHHLPYHPARLREPARRLLRQGWPSSRVPTSVEAAVAAVASAISASSRGGSVAVLDPRPGRALSAHYRRFLAALPDGLYIAAPPAEEAFLDRIGGMLGAEPGALGCDLEHCRTLLSFGAPILEGWGGPGRAIRLRFGSGAGRPRFIQAETRPSDTALFADRRLALKPGTEGILARGLANLILQEGLCDRAALSRCCPGFEAQCAPGGTGGSGEFGLERVSRITGLRPEEIRETAGDFVGRTPSLAIAGSLGQEDEIAVAALNLLAGSVGREGGVLFRAPVPETAYPSLPALATVSLQEVRDHSLRVLILDGSLGGTPFTWSELEKKLLPEGALVVSLSPYLLGHALRADYVVPAPAWLEGFEEAGTPPASPSRQFGISVPLLPTPPRAVDPARFIHRVATLAGISLPHDSSETLLRQKAQAIFDAGGGEIFRSSDSRRVPLSAAASADGFWKILTEGGWFVEEADLRRTASSFRRSGRVPEKPPWPASLKGDSLLPDDAADTAFPLLVLPFRPAGPGGEEPAPLLCSKLDRESGLRPAPGWALMHPRTGLGAGLRDGATAWMETPAGRLRVLAKFDASVRPGLVHLAVGPSPGVLPTTGPGKRAVLSMLGGSIAPGPERSFRARMREA